MFAYMFHFGLHLWPRRNSQYCITSQSMTESPMDLEPMPSGTQDCLICSMKYSCTCFLEEYLDGKWRQTWVENSRIRRIRGTQSTMYISNIRKHTTHQRGSCFSFLEPPEGAPQRRGCVFLYNHQQLLCNSIADRMFFVTNN